MTLMDRLQSVRNRLIDRGDYDQHGADVVDATTIGEAMLELARLESQLAGLVKPAPTGFGDAR